MKEYIEAFFESNEDSLNDYSCIRKKALNIMTELDFIRDYGEYMKERNKNFSVLRKERSFLKEENEILEYGLSRLRTERDNLQKELKELEKKREVLTQLPDLRAEAEILERRRLELRESLGLNNSNTHQWEQWYPIRDFAEQSECVFHKPIIESLEVFENNAHHIRKQLEIEESLSERENKYWNYTEEFSKKIARQMLLPFQPRRIVCSPLSDLKRVFPFSSEFKNIDGEELIRINNVLKTKDSDIVALRLARGEKYLDLQIENEWGKERGQEFFIIPINNFLYPKIAMS